MKNGRSEATSALGLSLSVIIIIIIIIIESPQETRSVNQ